MSDILRFCELYNEMKTGGDSCKIAFSLSYQRIIDTDLLFSSSALFDRQIVVFQLDEEDIEYLYKKYSSFLEKQKEDEIKAIEKKYNEVINLKL